MGSSAWWATWASKLPAGASPVEACAPNCTKSSPRRRSCASTNTCRYGVNDAAIVSGCPAAAAA